MTGASPSTLDRYRIVRKLATGGMAEVFLAEETGLGGFKKRVAIKRILPAYAGDREFLDLFLDEARLAAMFQHPNLVQIFDLGEIDGLLCIVMEYVQGATLAQLAEATRKLGRPAFPPAIAARILAQACDALDYAHGFTDPDSGQALGLVHRDVSPQNLLISKEGFVKVADFGIARAAGQIHHTSPGRLKGKMAYMPPEQMNGRPIDRRSDVWALGVMLYELLTGRPLFTGDDEMALFRAVLVEPIKPLLGIPGPLRSTALGALTRRIDQRTASAAAMSGQLEDWLQKQPRVGQAEVAAWMKPLLAALESPAAATPAAPLPAPARPQHVPPASPEALFPLPEAGEIANPGTPEAVLAQPVARSPTSGELANPSAFVLSRWLSSLLGLRRVTLTAGKVRQVFHVVDGVDVWTPVPLADLAGALAAPHVNYRVEQPTELPETLSRVSMPQLTSALLRQLLRPFDESRLAAGLAHKTSRSAKLLPKGKELIPALGLIVEQLRLVDRLLYGPSDVLEVLHDWGNPRASWELLYLLEAFGALEWGDPPASH
jgi:serine/threonine-protein kinase